MQVFISWSGDESKKVAEVLRKWLRQVVQTVEPWMSDRDLASGARWSEEIKTKLCECKVGIVCLTAENVQAPWLHFEAGALSNAVEGSFVCPLLFRIDPSDIKGPLAQFQARRFSYDGISQILDTIRHHPGNRNGLNDVEFMGVLDQLWPSLEDQVKKIHADLPAPSKGRPVPDMLSEVLELVRAISRQRGGEASAVLQNVLREESDDGSPYGRRPATGLNASAKGLNADELVSLLLKWDSTLPKLLGGEHTVWAMVKALLSGNMGEATTVVMGATGYELPAARMLVDATVVAIARLTGA